jgi:hypothetical protein
MKIIAFNLFLLLALSAIAQNSRPIQLPAVFQSELIHLSLPMGKDSLRLYTDTGGKNYIYKSGTRKLKAKRGRKNVWSKSNIEAVFREQNIPIPQEKELYYYNDRSSDFDGMLGREWFAGKIWEFDYVDKTLSHLPESGNHFDDSHEAIKLFFRSDSTGNHLNHLARIQIIVQSDTLSMLFDTGAQAYLSPEAQRKLNENELVATSFINASVFDKWKMLYPEWSILEGADRSFNETADMIIVPEVIIGSKVVGPVGFTKRGDSNFEVMSDFFMDAEIVGALGGNALAGLKRFVLDYKAERLLIEK